MNPGIERVAFLFAVLALAGLAGCAVPGEIADRDWTDGRDVRPGTLAEWGPIRDRQADRLAGLSRFSSAGTFIIEFEEEDGRTRTERLNHRLWRVAPDKAALRLSLAGMTGARLGWNGDRWWILDEMPDRPELRVVDLATSGPGAQPGNGMMAPPMLMVALGLMPYPEKAPEDFEVAGDRARFTLDSTFWQGTAGDASSRQRVRVVTGDPLDGPVGIELVDPAGEASVIAVLGRFDSVETLGRPPGAWPNLPHRIEVVSNGTRQGRWVATFDQPLAQGRISERLFDLDALVERSDPIIIESGSIPSLPVFQSEDGP